MAAVQDPAEDQALLQRWSQGDEDAGRALFERHFDSVYRFFRAKLQRGAEDLAQQTFLGLVKAAPRYRGDSSVRTYLFSIARNTLYSHLREKSRKPLPNDLGEMTLADVGGESPSRAAQAGEEHKLLLRAMRRLPLDMQIALEMFYWEDLPIPEIAVVLDVPVGTIKARLKRARDRLEGLITELAQTPVLAQSTCGDFEGWARGMRAMRFESDGAESAGR